MECEKIITEKKDGCRGKIAFSSREHQRFYKEYIEKCQPQDTYHQALVYCLGIDQDTRKHIDRIFDFKTNLIKPECLFEGWQTGGSQKVVRLAFNLYTNGTPSVFDFENEGAEVQLRECRKYTVEDIFCCGYARYFWEAVKIRYPEQTGVYGIEE